MNVFELIANNCFPSLHFVHKGVLLLLVLAYLSFATWLWIRTRKRAAGICLVIFPICVAALGEVFLMLAPPIKQAVCGSSSYGIVNQITGYYGVVSQAVLLSLAVIYIAAIWFIIKRQVEQVFQLAVVCIYIVAGFNWYAFYFQSVLQYSFEQGAPRFSYNFWIWTYGQLILTIFFIAAMTLLVLISIFTRPKKKPLLNPGCIPGCITALLGTLILQLCFLCVWFGSGFQAHKRECSSDHRRQYFRIKELERIIQLHNQRTDMQKEQPPDIKNQAIP